MKKDRISLELRVGIFVVIAAIAILLFIFTQAARSNYRGYEIGVTFDYISGLETGSPVRVSGVRAGEVRKIEILYDVKPKVLIKLKLRNNIKIGRYSRITIQSLGLIGEKYIEIAPSFDKDYIQSGETVDGENPLSMERLVEASQGIVVRLNNILTDISILSGDEKIRENIKNIVNDSAAAISKIENTFEKMGEFTEDATETNRKLQELLVRNDPKLEKLLNSTNELVVSTTARMEKTLKEIERFASTGTDAAESLKEIQKTAVSFGDVAKEIQNFLFKLQNEGLVAKILSEEELFDQIKQEVVLLHDATKQFKQTAETINSLSEDMGIIVSDLKNGQGTAGMFLRSDEIYKDVSAFIKDIKENPWKLFLRRR